MLPYHDLTPFITSSWVLDIDSSSNFKLNSFIVKSVERPSYIKGLGWSDIVVTIYEPLYLMSEIDKFYDSVWSTEFDLTLTYLDSEHKVRFAKSYRRQVVQSIDVEPLDYEDSTGFKTVKITFKNSK